MELERETARARRTGQPLVLGYVDVDGLKATNDSLGHAAGDRLLRQVVDTIRGHFRAYDLIVRFGGDEFVCAFLDLTLEEAGARFARVNDDLDEIRHAHVTVGLVELQADETLQNLILRGDEALYRERGQRPPNRA